MNAGVSNEGALGVMEAGPCRSAKAERAAKG